MTPPKQIWISDVIVEGLTGKIGTWIDRAESHRVEFVPAAATRREILAECLAIANTSTTVSQVERRIREAMGLVV